MWELLGGMGKSRVIATMALMLLEQGYSKFHILLPTVALMNRDKEEFSDYWVKSCNVQKVEYHTNFEFDMEEGAIIISDEADYLMLKNPQAFFDAAKSYPMISMTASLPLSKSNTKSLEETVMKKMNMEIFSYSRIQNTPSYDIEEELPIESDDKLTERLQSMTQ